MAATSLSMSGGSPNARLVPIGYPIAALIKCASISGSEVWMMPWSAATLNRPPRNAMKCRSGAPRSAMSPEAGMCRMQT